jgi:hypothetical protein
MCRVAKRDFGMTNHEMIRLFVDRVGIWNIGGKSRDATVRRLYRKVVAYRGKALPRIWAHPFSEHWSRFFLTLEK